MQKRTGAEELRIVSRSGQTSAVVIGAGIAGLLSARVLSEHVERVTVLERDRLPGEPVPRRGLSQGRHAHVLLLAGLLALEDWFPGLIREMVDAGAVPIDSQDMVWHQGGGVQLRCEMGVVAMSLSRPLLENLLRERLLRQCANVEVREQVLVDGPIVEGNRVVGVEVDGVRHRADLVVGCTGRHTRLLDQLADHGFPLPQVSSIGIDMTYGSCTLTRRPDDLDGSLALVVEAPQDGHRIGMLAPVEHDRWILSICSYHGEMPPTDMDAFERYARSLPSARLADVLARAEPLSVVSTQRTTSAQRRRMEDLDRTPAGFVILGDSLCSLNPVYSQGMSAAALQAQALDQALKRHGPAGAQMPKAFYRKASRAVDGPWKMNAWSDFTDPRTTGRAPAGTGLVNAYLRQVVRACHTSAPVARKMLRVRAMVAGPWTLMTPATAVRALLAARHSPHPTGGPGSALPGFRRGTAA